MTGFKGIFKKRVSNELRIILEDNCPSCLSTFNDTDLAPYCLYPCQHYFCKQCIENKVSRTICDTCSQDISPDGIKKCSNRIRLARIISKFQHEEPQNREDLQRIQRQVGLEIFNENIYYYCNQCDQPFDRYTKQAMVVCMNEHLVCSDCIKNKNFKVCPFCKETLLDNLIPSNLVISLCDFIQKVVFSHRLQFVVKDTSYNITTCPDTTLKDIFFKLRDCDIISPKLDIRNCHFLVSNSFEEKGQPREADYKERIGEMVNKVELIYDQKAMMLGSHLLTPSKLIKDLPIKISNFRPINSIRYEVDDDEEEQVQFGQEILPQVSELDLYPALNPSKVLVFNKESLKNWRQNPLNQSQVPEFKKRSPNKWEEKDLSFQQKSLIKQSSHREEMIREEKDMAKIIKKSRIMNLKEFPIGSKCPDSFIQNYSTALPSNQRKDVLKRFLDLHQTHPDDQKLLCFQVEKVMNQPFTPAEIEQSAGIEKNIEDKAMKGEHQSMILKLLKQQLESGELRVMYTPKSTDRSKLTLKILTSHYLSDRFIIRQTFDEDMKYYFQSLFASEAKTHQFLTFQKKKYANRFGIEEESIVFHNLIKGSLVTEFSINDGSSFTKFIKNNLEQDIQIHPYFTQLELCQEDFDEKGRIKFNQEKNDIEFRGNLPYYQPIKCERFGIRVLGQFDGGNNIWLRMKNEPGEWAVGFHEFKHPNEAFKHYKNTIRSILSGLHGLNNRMIEIENSEQAHVDSSCVNFPSEKVGRGVYLSPMFASCLQYANTQKVGDKEYRLVFQCRINPHQIRIPKDKAKQKCWVVNKSEAIRPYGIILIENSIAMSYPSPMQQFKQEFEYEKYRERIEKALKAMPKGPMNKSSASTS